MEQERMPQEKHSPQSICRLDIVLLTIRSNCDMAFLDLPIVAAFMLQESRKKTSAGTIAAARALAEHLGCSPLDHPQNDEATAANITFHGPVAHWLSAHTAYFSE